MFNSENKSLSMPGPAEACLGQTQIKKKSLGAPGGEYGVVLHVDRGCDCVGVAPD